MHPSRKLILAGALALFALLAGRAEAAPQILGLMASNGLPAPMRCPDGICTAFIARFCLQEARAAPNEGQEYTPSSGGLRLIVSRPDGGRLTVPGDDLLTLRLYSGLATVQASLSSAGLASRGIHLGAADVISIDVGTGAAMLPVAAANDPDPQTPQEIALATGPLRRLAAATFDDSSKMPNTARLLGLLINALPAEDDSRPVALEALLRRIGAQASPRLSREALAETAEIVKNCRPFPATALAQGFCLESLQHGLISTLNQEYWVAAGGS